MEFYDNHLAFETTNMYWIIEVNNKELNINGFSSASKTTIDYWVYNFTGKYEQVNNKHMTVEEIFKLFDALSQNKLNLNYSMVFPINIDGNGKAPYSSEILITNIDTDDRSQIILHSGYSQFNSMRLFFEKYKNIITIKSLLHENNALKEQTTTFKEMFNMMNSYVELISK